MDVALDCLSPLGLHLPSDIEGAGLHHFRTHVLDLISFSQHGQGHPFVTLVLPMVFDSVLMRLAIEATATAHLHNLGVASRKEPMRLQSKALRHLSDALSETNPHAETTIYQEELAWGIMILVYYETTFGLSAMTARWHLSAICNILNNLSQKSCQSPRVEFLTRLFAYFDISVALSLQLQPLAAPPSSTSRSFCSMSGYILTLYPHLHALATLLAQKHSCQRSDSTFDGPSVRALERELLAWRPPELRQFPEAESTYPRPQQSNSSDVFPDPHIHDRLLQTALAFRSAALLVVSGELLPLPSPTSPTPPSSSSYTPETHYRELLDHLLRLNSLALTSAHGSTTTTTTTTTNNGSPSSPNIPPTFIAAAVTCSPLTTITWPLHTAALHAKTAADRTLLSCMFERVHQRHQMGVVGAAKRHVEHIWRGQQQQQRRWTTVEEVYTEDPMSTGSAPPLLA